MILSAKKLSLEEKLAVPQHAEKPQLYPLLSAMLRCNDMEDTKVTSAQLFEGKAVAKLLSSLANGARMFTSEHLGAHTIITSSSILQVRSKMTFRSLTRDRDCRMISANGVNGSMKPF